jgi:hypothetical protein
LWALLALVVVGLPLSGWLIVSYAHHLVMPHNGSKLRVIFSGETQGELEPCNCSGKMAGGLPARGGYLAGQGGEFLLLDTGCLGNGARDFEIIRTEATLRGMAAMHYDAANVGEHELWLGSYELARLAGLDVTFVSANVRATNGRTVPGVSPFLTLQRNGLKIAVTGLVDSTRYQLGSGLAVDPPREALARLLPHLSKEAGVIVVLADLDLPAVKELAQDFPEVTLILFRGRGDAFGPERINRTIVATVFGEARYLGDVNLSWSSPREVAATGTPVLLDDRFPPSTAVARACIDWYKKVIDGRIFNLYEPRPGWDRIAFRQPDAGNSYIGSAACARCHPYQYKKYQEQDHARAMASLQKINYDYSPECIVCHTDGYGASDGYKKMGYLPDLGRVGCESCHGRGGLIVGDHTSACVPLDGPAACRQCHVLKRDPDFDFAKRWPKISHKENG